MRLIFGVLDIAYGESHGSSTSTTTTGQVADILESRYRVMGTFYDLKGPQIADALTDALAIRVQDLFRGVATPSSPLHGAEQKIETLFRRFIYANEMQKIALALTGAPLSAAAMKGISHRKKQVSKKRKSRPAFVDTGLYTQSFRAQIKL